MQPCDTSSCNNNIIVCMVLAEMTVIAVALFFKYDFQYKHDNIDTRNLNIAMAEVVD